MREIQPDFDADDRAPSPRGVRERIGRAIGRAWAPAIAAIARRRHARMFHPDGDVAAGWAVPVEGCAYPELAARLEGPVLARCSGALRRRGHDSFDVLGIALRFRSPDGDVADVAARPGDQDLLFATILSPFTMVVSPFTTRWNDFLANRYYAVSPFEVEDAGRMKLRMSPMCLPHQLADDSRAARLTDEIAFGEARWLLEARPVFRWPWQPVAAINLDALIEVDQSALRFDPFRTGRGIVPGGLVHAIRAAAYPASQSQR